MNRLMSTLRLMAVALAVLPVVAMAEDEVTPWSFKAGIGYNVGGTSPLPLPAEIRKINKFNPTFCYSLQARAERSLGDVFSMAAALRYETKGMETDATVKSYHMSIIQDGAHTEGYWTGGVETTYRSQLLTVPVLAAWQTGERWQLYAGPFASAVLKNRFTGEVYEGYLRELDPTGEKAVFSDDKTASYDLSDDLRRFQWGAEIGAEYKPANHFAVTLQLDWGLQSVFPSGYETITFGMYPIYGNIGLVYVF